MNGSESVISEGIFTIRYMAGADRDYWFSLDKYLSDDEFFIKMRDKRGYVLRSDGVPAGIMRYNLFWDSVPFVTLIYIIEGQRGKGLGTYAMSRWEDEMRDAGHKLVMTSTQADENAQHFYRKLGYRDAGCLLLDDQATELFMAKKLL